MAKGNKIDWDKVREEFETTPATLQELAEKYNVSPGTVRDPRLPTAGTGGTASRG